MEGIGHFYCLHAPLNLGFFLSMKKLFPIIISALVLSFLAVQAQDGAKNKAKAKAAQEKVYPTGYTDTPFLPGGKWRVHDDARPRPEVVTPGATASQPPSDAIVLFDGTGLSEWIMAKNNEPADWIVGDGYFEVPPKDQTAGGPIRTKREFENFQLHIEWASPAEVTANSQGRGNSGVFFPGGFELQVLDSFENKSYADGQASALYGWKPPLVNACREPGQWQTYEIIFESPKWDAEGNLLKKAYITVLHNGVLTHHRQAYLGATGHKRVANYNRVTGKGPIELQNHSNPVRFRNIWIRELDLNAND